MGFMSGLPGLCASFAIRHLAFGILHRGGATWERTLRPSGMRRRDLLTLQLGRPGKSGNRQKELCAMSESGGVVPYEGIERRILLIRGQKVMLDAHLADLYGVETKALVRAVKRNAARFPSDFMFRLTAGEF